MKKVNFRELFVMRSISQTIAYEDRKKDLTKRFEAEGMEDPAKEAEIFTKSEVAENTLERGMIQSNLNKSDFIIEYDEFSDKGVIEILSSKGFNLKLKE